MRYRKMQQTVNAMNTIVFSMRYRKMQQTVNAMKTILGEMRDQDYITILRYSWTHKTVKLENDT